MKCSLRIFVFAAALTAVFHPRLNNQLLFAEPLPAERPSAAEEMGPATPELALQDGLALEQERSWGDAIRYYESSLRSFHNHPELSKRLLICRLHYDVHRRYEDASFASSIQQTPSQQALDLYGEVLGYLETHYVDTPNWPQVLRYGTASLEVALTEKLFLDSQLPNVPAEKIEQFRQTVHRYVLSRPATSRFDLRATASYIAGIAKQELGLASTATVMEYCCGAISTLDPYSRFLTSNQLDDTFSNIEGNLVGLGVELQAESDRLRIVNVLPKGPAFNAGIVAGDAIVGVDGTMTVDSNPDMVADLLRGPEGSSVQVQLVTADGEAKTLNFQRARVEVPCVENVQIVDKNAGIGYFRLTSFQRTTTRDVDNALWNLHRQGMQQLIIDLRRNPGGLLTAAVEVADRFVRRGRIVTTRGKNPRENFDYVAHEVNTWNVPLIVLIDGDSASASEIFAGAIRDQNRGYLVGQRSYGKGSVQGIFRMESAHAGLCLTTAKFFSPNNIAISDRGVEPNLEVAPTYIAARPTEDGGIATVEQDAILTAAIQYAQGARLTQRP